MSLLKLADDLMVSIGEEVMVIREKKYRGQINKNILELATAGSPMVRGGRFEDRGYGYGIGKPSTYGFKFVKARVFKSKFVQGENFKTYWGPSDFGEMRRWPDRLGQSKNYHQVIEDIDPPLVEYMEEESTDSDSEDDDGAFPAGYDDY